MKTLVISQRIDEYPDRGERRDALDQALVRFVRQADYLPILVPNSLVDTSSVDLLAVNMGILSLTPPKVGSLLEHFLLKVNPDGIVLSGGNDVGSCIDRDVTEAILIRYAIKFQIPLLGICRGMQMLGVYSGAELRNVDLHVRTRHFLKGNYTHEVNSYHNQSLMGVPTDYQITASSEDGAIEAIKHNRLPLYGWMWHPERESPFNKVDMENFRKIFG